MKEYSVLAVILDQVSRIGICPADDDRELCIRCVYHNPVFAVSQCMRSCTVCSEAVTFDMVRMICDRGVPRPAGQVQPNLVAREQVPRARLRPTDLVVFRAINDHAIIGAADNLCSTYV